MKSTITQYKTIASETAEEIDAKVNKLLKKGWVLYDVPHHFLREASIPNRMAYTQTMVKYEDK